METDYNWPRTDSEVELTLRELIRNQEDKHLKILLYKKVYKYSYKTSVHVMHYM